MISIAVKHLSKYYEIHKKEPGFSGSLKSFFNRKYETTKAVNDISFTIEEGELIGFIGPNGAGKTTTLKCLSGLLYPDHGEVRVLGHNPFKREDNFLKKIALVMGQKNQMWWDLPAMDSFILNKEIYEVSDNDFKNTLGELSELLDVKNILHIPVRRLSLGQRMKCELIAALIHRPKILFMDEPTIGLDVVMQKKLRDFIKDYNKRYKSTILLTSHYMEDVRQLCKRVLIIDHGKLLYDGNLSNIVKEYAKYKTITIIFEKEVQRKSLEKLGIIKEYSPLQLVLSVEKDKSKQIISRILAQFPVEDLNIEEADLEDIIRGVFTSKYKKLKNE